MHLRANQGVVSMRSSLESYNSLYLYSSKVNQSLANTAALTSGLTEISEDRFDCRSDQNHNDATHSFRHTHRHTHSWGCSKQKESGRAAAVMQLDSLQCYSPPTPLSLILFLCHSLPPLSSFLFSTHTHTHRWQEASTRVCPSCVSPGDEGYPQIPHYHNDTWNMMLCRWREMKKQNSKCVRASDVSLFIFYSLCSHVSIFVRSKESEDMLSKCGHQPWHQHLRDKMRKNAKKKTKNKNTKKPSGYNRC